MELTPEHRSIGKQISHISRNIQWIIQHELEAYGIGSGPHFFLHLIQKNPGITQNEVSHRTDIDKATAAKGLAKLEQLGYIERIPDENDRRIRHLHLTEAGKTVIPTITETLQKVTRVCSTDLTSDELDDLFYLLDKVEASLNTYIKTNKGARS